MPSGFPRKGGGTSEVRCVGSHHIFKHPKRPGHLTVPHPKKDLGKGLVQKIKEASGAQLTTVTHILYS